MFCGGGVGDAAGARKAVGRCGSRIGRNSSRLKSREDASVAQAERKSCNSVAA